MSKILSHPIELPAEINNFQLISYLGGRRYLVRSVVCGCTIEKYYSNIVSCVNGMCNTCRKEQDTLKKKPRNTKRGLIAKHQKTGNTWRAMKGRCLDKNNQDYYLYGGNGVIICDRWLEPNGQGFRNFLEDMGERPEGMTLNRVGCSKIYSKETCEWADTQKQCFDKRIYSNKDKPVGIRAFENGWVVNFRKNYLTYTKDFIEACNIRAKAEFDYFGCHLQDWEEIEKNYETNNRS